MSTQRLHYYFKNWFDDNPIKKWKNNLNRHLTRHMGGEIAYETMLYITSNVKTTVNYHSILTRMVKIIMTDDIVF